MTAKIRKSYRFSARATQALDRLKTLYPDWTETSIIEAALENFYIQEIFYHQFVENRKGDKPNDLSRL